MSRLSLAVALWTVAACATPIDGDLPNGSAPRDDAGGGEYSGGGGVLPGDHDGGDPDEETGGEDTDGGDGGGETGGGETGGDGGGETGGDAASPVRFLVLGDGGRGTPEQYAVAAGMEAVCARVGCDFAIHLGDNILGDGVGSVDDEQFEEKFEAPYAGLDFPFYMALGNHDWAPGPEGAYAQVEYTARSTKWKMPAQYYSVSHGEVTLFALDTQPIREGDTAPQQAWIEEALASASTRWKVGFGHHPYISNGEHGDTGGDFANFFDRNLCGKVDVYLSSHDHDLQWLQPQCGTEFMISGGASSLRETGLGDNPTFYEESTNGFLWVEIAGDTLTGAFYDKDGRELFRRVVQR